MPNTSLNIHAHICAETTVGIAHGISTAARRMPRPPKWALSARAMPAAVRLDTAAPAKTSTTVPLRPSENVSPQASTAPAIPIKGPVTGDRAAMAPQRR